MNVPNEELDRWRRMALEVRNLLIEVSLGLNGEEPTQARRYATQAHGLAEQLVTRLDAAGAEPTHSMPSRTTPLRLLDTEASRAYLGALREARRAAIVMDSERYSPGMAEGCDTPAAGRLDLMVAGMEMEIFGATEPPYAPRGEVPRPDRQP